jgi:hypothetical protein
VGPEGIGRSLVCDVENQDAADGLHPVIVEQPAARHYDSLVVV